MIQLTCKMTFVWLLLFSGLTTGCGADDIDCGRADLVGYSPPATAMLMIGTDCRAKVSLLDSVSNDVVEVDLPSGEYGFRLEIDRNLVRIVDVLTREPVLEFDIDGEMHPNKPKRRFNVAALRGTKHEWSIASFKKNGQRGEIYLIVGLEAP